MSKVSATGLKKAEQIVMDFGEEFNAVINITNQKGPWLCRITKKHVQILVTTGETIFELMVVTAKKITEMRKKLGK